MLSSEDIILPRYLKVSTFSSIWYHYHNSFPAATREAFSSRQRKFPSAPLLHILVLRCPAINVSQVTNISNFLHWGWVPIPLSRITMLYSTCRCNQRIWRLVQMVALPGHPSTSQAMEMAICDKLTMYYIGVGVTS